MLSRNRAIMLVSKTCPDENGKQIPALSCVTFIDCASDRTRGGRRVVSPGHLARVGTRRPRWTCLSSPGYQLFGLNAGGHHEWKQTLAELGLGGEKLSHGVA